MDNDHSDNKSINDERRERAVDAVLQRIAAAPARTIETRALPNISWVDFGAWTVPALAAAAILMIVSGAIILRTDQPATQEISGAAQLAGLSSDVPAPVLRYLTTGEITPMEWLSSYGGRQ